MTIQEIENAKKQGAIEALERMIELSKEKGSDFYIPIHWVEWQIDFLKNK